MRLQSKMILMTSTVFIIALLFAGIIFFSNSKINLENQVENGLNSTSHAIEHTIEAFLAGQENKIELIATQSELTIEELKSILSLDDSFYEMFVINSSGIVVVSSNSARVGLDRANRTYFTNARNQTYISPVYFALVPGEYSIAVSTPFREGVLVGAMKLDVLDRIASDRAGLGETGEILFSFINENGDLVYFSKRLFSEQRVEVVPREQAVSRLNYHAMLGNESLNIGLKDYRNMSVISAMRYIDSIKVGMVAKIDESEAFASVYGLQKVAIFLMLVTIGMIILAVYVISKQISGEIKDLESSIDRITKGELNIHLKKSTLLEIQKLTDSLNRILASMKLAILRTGASKSELGLGEAIKAKEEAEEKYKRLYESSSDAIMTIEPPEWRFTSGNPATLEMFGVEDEKQLASLTPGELSPRKQPDGQLSSVKSKRMIKKAVKEGTAFFGWTHKRYQGDEFPANVLLSRVKEKGKTYLQATVRDLSNQKKNKTARL